jgi:D-beta-D-heptose 7-phosphate kinase/D-beta-D-heptose 1-phosphate adenosyltransferase
MIPTLTRNRVRQIIQDISGKHILVLGDVMLDEFIWGSVGRISPEAPVPVVEVRSETASLGGAGNVAANIRALGAMPVLVGIIGQDSGADRIQQLIRSGDIEGGALLKDGRPTTVKTRIVAHHQQIVRADRESRSPLNHDQNRALADAFLKWLPRAQAIVISDYNKGVANQELLSTVLPEARRSQIPVFLDPKVRHADYFRPITLITPNQKEAEMLTGVSIENENDLEQAGKRLLEIYDCPYALITRGEAGMSLFDRQRSHHLPTFAREVFDVTGAGDTVIATLAAAAAGGAAVEEAAILANHAAGIVVGKIGTATVSPAELISDFESRNAHSAG